MITFNLSLADLDYKVVFKERNKIKHNKIVTYFYSSITYEAVITISEISHVDRNQTTFSLCTLKAIYMSLSVRNNHLNALHYENKPIQIYT